VDLPGFIQSGAFFVLAGICASVLWLVVGSAIVTRYLSEEQAEERPSHFDKALVMSFLAPFWGLIFGMAYIQRFTTDGFGGRDMRPLVHVSEFLIVAWVLVCWIVTVRELRLGLRARRRL
jgi:hypothetical protein